ncbi:MAG: ABC transporter ATP-binding protein [Thermoplasmata archaeon]|uniref:ABC transporter ATP-binding protein n=1 Tax=Candidatus Sysuiplasma superficiale TaxID=2823368 RepID=A0A8J7YU12_9ARCH|nr:ABC transporter ATP-binding protein [Candidatus Sysuiplasma superficiale]MBX8644087.1 ABC transporter ATP-binding protein [Candidatus Sysuiplasma superficiale]MCL5437248.1 ABC transporter ATP-binding protein [Candidatus Thermoplasmatota archaeon]
MQLLEVSKLNISYRTKNRTIHAVRDLSISVNKGEIIGLVGESGSGKSTFGMSLLRLLPRSTNITAEKMVFNVEDSSLGTSIDILKLSERELRRLRWKHVSVVFQGSMNALNPVAKIGDQFADAMYWHGYDDETIENNIISYLDLVHLDRSVRLSYPHELSGGMKQRVAIAMALVCSPELVIADEPTTALDVVVQRKILKLLKDTKEKLNLSIIFITHDISLLALIADRIAVMYAGSIVEIGDVRTLFRNPLHPYTKGLMSIIPRVDERQTELVEIQGSPPDLSVEIKGCPFAPRCYLATEVCTREMPELREMGASHFVSCHNAEMSIDGKTR